MSKHTPRPRINPILAKLTESGSHSSIVELQGFVGPTGSDDVVRLYADLSMTHYVDVPREAVLHFEESSESSRSPTCLWLSGDAQIAPQTMRMRIQDWVGHCNSMAYHATQLGLMARQATERGDFAEADKICQARENLLNSWYSSGCSLSPDTFWPEYNDACGNGTPVARIDPDRRRFVVKGQIIEKR